MRSIALIAGLAVAGCSGAEPDRAPARRIAVAGVGFDRHGISGPIRVRIPPGTRSLAIVAEGDPQALYALAWLRTADGVEHVRLPAGMDVPGALRERYLDKQIDQMPGAMRQTIRLGLFTHVHPNRAREGLPPGEVVVRVATSSPGHPVDVRLLMAEATGARRLPVHIVSTSPRFPYLADDPGSVPFLEPLRRILAGGGIELVVERVVHLPDRRFAAMTELNKPQEPPTSESSALALAGGAALDGDALNLYIVDSLPGQVGGWTLGTPGPPEPDTCYSGVVVARLDQGPTLARILAHELCHYLGLRHVEDIDVDGRRYTDALDDTEPGRDNLMDGGTGTALTADQRAVLARSPWLR